MNKRATKYACLLAILAVAAVLPLRAQGNDQGKPEVYTYIAQWAVPRAQWPDMVKLDDQERPLMEKMVADGSILDYGTFTTLIHQEGEPTHGSWFTASSEGKLMKALEQIYALGLTTSPVEAESKHWDLVLHSHSYNGRSGHYEGAYLSGSSWQVKPDEGRAFSELINSSLVPVLDKLVADGSVVSYSLSSEDYHMHKPGTVSLVYTTADANGLDKVDAAFEAAFSKDHSIGPAIATLTDGDEHRDFLLRVSHMMIK
jgi:hypothetical protein